MAFNKYTATNLAQGTVGSTLSAGSVTLVLSAGQGALFPSTFPFILKIEGFTSGNVVRREFVKVTNRVSDTLTIVRGFEPCPATYLATTLTSTAFQFEIGDIVNLVISKETILDIQNEVSNKASLTGATFTGLCSFSEFSIASATTTNLATATGGTVTITGTTTITSFGTVTAGTVLNLIFSGSLTLTHNATSLILPTSANITTQAGDTAIIESKGSGNWVVLNYQRKDGTSLVAVASEYTINTFIAGENITIGDALYVSNGAGARTSGRVYKASSLLTTYSDMNNFVGFCAGTVTTGSSATVITAGTCSLFSALTVGRYYYLTDTAGVISLTPGSNVIQVGLAGETTSIGISFEKKGGLASTTCTVTGGGTTAVYGTSIQSISGGIFTAVRGNTTDTTAVNTNAWGFQFSKDNSTWVTMYTSNYTGQYQTSKETTPSFYLYPYGYVRVFAGGIGASTVSLTITGYLQS